VYDNEISAPTHSIIILMSFDRRYELIYIGQCICLEDNGAELRKEVFQIYTFNDPKTTSASEKDIYIYIYIYIYSTAHTHTHTHTQIIIGGLLLHLKNIKQHVTQVAGHCLMI